MIRCHVQTCDLTHDGDRAAAVEAGWLMWPDPDVPVLCPLDAEGLIVGSHHVFGPEYEQLASRVPVDGDTLLTLTGVYVRVAGEWVLEREWDRAGAAA